jgi:hypothetical protein
MTVSFEEANTVARGLTGITLKVYNELVYQTRHGKRWQVICAATIAAAIKCSVRSVRAATKRLIALGLLAKRPRFAKIQGFWKQVSNAYRVLKPKPSAPVKAVVERVAGGWQRKIGRLMGEGVFTVSQKDRYSPDLDQLFEGRKRSPDESLAGLRARMARPRGVEPLLAR